MCVKTRGAGLGHRAAAVARRFRVWATAYFVADSESQPATDSSAVGDLACHVSHSVGVYS